MATRYRSRSLISAVTHSHNPIGTAVGKVIDTEVDFMYPFFQVAFWLLLPLAVTLCSYSYFLVLPDGPYPTHELGLRVCHRLGAYLGDHWWAWFVIPWGASVLLACAFATVVLEAALAFVRSNVKSWLGG